MKKIEKRLLSTLGISVAAIAGYVAVSEYFYNKAIRRNMKKFMEKEKIEDIIQDDQKQKQKEELETWRNASTVEECVIQAFDHLRLHGEKITNHLHSNRWVIVVHGYDSCASRMNFVAKKFDQEKYNIILMDCRGHGMSEGNYIGMGWHDRLDIMSWIQEIIKDQPQAEIVLYGISMGASAVMMCCGEHLPTNVKCAIEDCGYSSVKDILKVEMKRYYNMPYDLLLPGVNALCKIHARFSLYEASSIKQLKKSVTPMFFIHGENDDFVPYEMVFECYNACSAPKELYTVAYSKHAESWLGLRYFERVFMFCDRYIAN